MAQVNATIAGRQFRLACEDGQEEQLQTLAHDIDQRIIDLRRKFGEIGDTRLTVSKDHYQNFLDCIKSRAKPICDVEIGHRSATVCHLGNIAVRLGRKFQWDPAKEQIVGDADAAAMLTKEYRAPWKLA